MPSVAAPKSSPRLILASRSPRRQALLREAGFTGFLVEPADVDEKKIAQTLGLLPAEVAIQIARAKARKVAADPRYRNDIVLAADTVIAFGDRVIGQPRDALHAKEILRLLSGTTHIVITGVAVRVEAANELRSARVMSAVRIPTLSERRLEAYLQTGLWRGKAGAYGIQDDNGQLATCTAGCRTNVIGLPMTTTMKLLAEVGLVPSSAH